MNNNDPGMAAGGGGNNNRRNSTRRNNKAESKENRIKRLAAEAKAKANAKKAANAAKKTAKTAKKTQSEEEALVEKLEIDLIEAKAIQKTKKEIYDLLAMQYNNLNHEYKDIGDKVIRNELPGYTEALRKFQSGYQWGQTWETYHPVLGPIQKEMTETQVKRDNAEGDLKNAIRYVKEVETQLEKAKTALKIYKHKTGKK